MTDKQIIIDGVDVSGCRYLFDDTSYKRSKTSCSITLKDCKYLGNNCYYKQLKHKEQECEKYEYLFNELDKRVSNNTKIFDCIVVSKIVKDIINKAKGGNKNE